MKEYKVYVHQVIDIDMYYVGITSQKLPKRFNNIGYINTSLGKYLNTDIPMSQNQNIKTIIVAQGLTREEALSIEDRLISLYKTLGKSANSNYSGLHSKNRDELYYERLKDWLISYRKQYYIDNRDEILQKVSQYRKEHYEERLEYNKRNSDHNKEYCKKYKEEHREELKEYRQRPEVKERERLYQQQPERKKYKSDWEKEFSKTPEGKIYKRVSKFNLRHPDKKIETPLEAKTKYLEWGYIPDYIKNDDLTNS